MRMVLVVSVLAVLISGCASVTRGWNEQIQFSSDPPEAQMRTTMGMACTTPCVLQIGRKDAFIATFSKPGYISEDVPVHTQMSGGGAAGMAGNVLVGGVIGVGVDAASGASLDHCPNPVSVRLRRIGSQEPPSNSAALCGQPAAAVAQIEER